MEILKNIFLGHSVSSSIMCISLAVALGILIGKIKLFKISLGIAGVLFSSIILGHIGMRLEKETLEFVREFGLILFVYSIGIQIGPSFFASFMKQGLRLNLLAAGIVTFGFAIASCMVLSGVPVWAAAGIMSGAVTNTPGLGAAQQAIAEGISDSQSLVQISGMAYAMCYPLGIIGIISVMLAIKKIFRIEISKEREIFENERDKALARPGNFNVLITNEKIAGTSIYDFGKLVKKEFVVSRIYRNGVLTVPSSDSKICLGDILHIVCSKETADEIFTLAGGVSNIDIRNVDDNFIAKKSLVTSADCIGKSIAELDFFSSHSVNITRIARAGIELVAAPTLKLQLGDIVTIVGPRDNVEAAVLRLGNSIKALEHPNIFPIFIGIIFGIIIGSIPIPVPGLAMPLKLGLSGGALLSAMIFGRIGQIGRLSWYLPSSANLAIREIGISLFLACVGLRAGEKFFPTLASAQGLEWMLLGICITVLPILTLGILSRIFFKLDYLSLCGLLAGSMTDPPALSFANQASGSDAPSISYATVYALTMFLRIMFAQLLVILFLK